MVLWTWIPFFLVFCLIQFSSLIIRSIFSMKIPLKTSEILLIRLIWNIYTSNFVLSSTFFIRKCLFSIARHDSVSTHKTSDSKCVAFFIHLTTSFSVL